MASAVPEGANQAQVRWETRRASEADAAGIMAASLHQQILDTVRHSQEAVVSGDGDHAAKLALCAQRLTVVYGILVDKADQLAGVEGAQDERPDVGERT